MSLSSLKQCGPKRLQALNEAGIFTREDLIKYLPRKYEDRRFITPFENWEVNSLVIVGGTVLSFENRRFPKEMTVMKMDVENGPVIDLVFFSRAGSFISKKYSEGMKLYVSGVLQQFKGYQIVHPDIQLQNSKPYKGELIPIYPMVESLSESGVNQLKLRKWIRESLSSHVFQESMDPHLMEKFHCTQIEKAYRQIHHPLNPDEAVQGFRTLKVMEIAPVAQEMLTHLIPQNGESSQLNSEAVNRVVESLPFSLTPGQLEAIHKIQDGLSSPHQSKMLLQADVGAGKTLVALLSAYALLKGEPDAQVVLMAPTEVLARQLMKVSCSLLNDIQISFLSGSLTPGEKEESYSKIRTGQSQLIIGTHALFQKAVQYHRLKFVIIDEQHRFGVEQREMLSQKGCAPDILMMSATPIPRSLVSTIYGSLQVIKIEGLPQGRVPTQSRLVPDVKRGSMIQYLGQYIQNSGLVYWVLPKIEGEEDLSVESRVQEMKQLGFQVQGLHGRMSDTQKTEILDAFRNHQAPILISTTVIEVGIDVPEANVIVIEGAHHFGLSQLHQLRGRVGRGGAESWCFLLSDNLEAEERLKSFCATNDGFEIAEQDLQSRGAGNLLGVGQSGWSELRFTDFYQDRELIQEVIKYFRLK